MVKLKTYPNGLRLIVKSLEGVLSVTAGVLVGAGSRYETAENNGISHFIEHMLFKGTEKRTAFEISDAIDRIGGQINAFTTKETTCYYVKSTAEHTEEAAEVLADIFFHSRFDEKETEREKGVIKEEINMYEDTPDELCFDLLAEAHFGNSGLGASVLGPAENIDAFTRKDIDDYMARFYLPQNTVICFAGNITFDEAERITDEYFANSFPQKVAFIPQESPCPVIFGRKDKKKEIEQAHVCFAYRGCAYGSKEVDYFNLFNTALGGGMSSVLFQKVREELGLAYNVYSFVSTYKDCGVLGVYAGVNPSNLDLAVNCILDEIAKFKRSGLTEYEFERAKEQIKGNFIFSQESNSSQMLLYAKYLLYTGKIFDFEKKIQTINSVGRKTLNAFIKDEFDISAYSKSIVAKDI